MPVTTPPKAAPITTPTAISTTLPRRMNFLKPSNMEKPPNKIGRKCMTRKSAGQARSEPVFWLRHQCYFVLQAYFCRNDRYCGANLIFGLPFGLLQEMPECIDKNVVCCCPLVFLRPAYFADPAYGCPVFRGQTNGCSVSIFRDVLLSRAHYSDSS